MTLRELFIALGYQIDESSEKKAEQGIQNLKNKATQIRRLKAGAGEQRPLQHRG